MHEKTLIIVGNAPLPRDLSAEVDAADFVVRFNEPKQSIGMSGTRTDLLMLATSSKPMQRRLRDPGFVQTPTFKAAKEVMLAYHPSIIRKYHPGPNFLSPQGKARRLDNANHRSRWFRRQGNPDHAAPILSGRVQRAGRNRREYKQSLSKHWLFGIWYMLGKCPEESWDVKICGFTWEGWKRHTWGDERSWVEQKVKSGRISLIQ